jgi:hypothetical protein
MSTADGSDARVAPRRKGDDSARQRGRDRGMERKTIRKKLPAAWTRATRNLKHRA